MKSTVLKLLILSIFAFFAINANAQMKVGSNPTTITPSAILELEGTNKALRLTRVALTSINDVTTVPAPVNGMMVYNTANAGSGTTAVGANSIYTFNGTTWDRLRNSSGTVLTNDPFQIGEIRSARFVVNSASFTALGSNRLMMSGPLATNVVSNGRRSAYELSLPIDQARFIQVNGLRLDFIRAADPNFPNYVSPKFFNTTASNMQYTLSALSTTNPNVSGANVTIVPNAYSYFIDGNDGMNVSAGAGGQNEYVNGMLTFPNGQWYIVTFTANQDISGTNHHFYMTAQRMN